MARGVAVLVLAVLAVGCRLEVGSDVVVAADGGGSVAVELVVDDELRDRLTAAGAAPADLVLGLAVEADRWSTTPVDEPGRAGVVLRADFAEPAGLGEAVAALTAGLDPDDGAVLEDVELTRTTDGGYRLELDAGIRPPAVVGSAPARPDGSGGPQDVEVVDDTLDGAALARELEQQGARLAVATLRVTMPTAPTIATGTGVVEGTTATVELPVHELGRVVVTAPPARWAPTQEQLAVAAVLLGLAAVAAGLWSRRS